MSKNDILYQFEKENKKGDEGELFQDKQAVLISSFVMIILGAISILITKDVKTFALIVGVILAGYGAGDLYRFIKIKKKKYIVSGIILVIAGVLFYLTFIANTLGWV